MQHLRRLSPGLHQQIFHDLGKFLQQLMHYEKKKKKKINSTSNSKKKNVNKIEP